MNPLYTKSQFKIKNGLCLCFFITLIFAFSNYSLKGQSSEDSLHYQDHLFAEKGGSMMTFVTGIPYVGVLEYTYGFSDRFSIGILGGSTPVVPGVGVRLRNILYSNGNNERIYARIPILYYPQTKDLGGELWLLTWPAINYEKWMPSGIRWSFGAGVVAAACVNDLLDLVGIREHVHDHDVHQFEPQSTEHHHGPSHHHEMGMEDHHLPLQSSNLSEGFMGGIWNTMQVGVALPIGKKWMFQTELAAVMKGVKMASEDWVGGPPVILTLAISRNF